MAEPGRRRWRLRLPLLAASVSLLLQAAPPAGAGTSAAAGPPVAHSRALSETIAALASVPTATPVRGDTQVASHRSGVDAAAVATQAGVRPGGPSTAVGPESRRPAALDTGRPLGRSPPRA